MHQHTQLLPLISAFIEELIWVPSLSRHQSFSNYLSVELAILKEMSEELATLFDLTLPVSLKK